MTQVVAACPLPAGGWVEWRCRRSDKRSAGVEVRHRVDQRAHALHVPGPHLPEGQHHHLRQRQSDKGLPGEPADVVDLVSRSRNSYNCAGSSIRGHSDAAVGGDQAE